ncbi:MAG TPA: hypothetical protein VKA89_03320, partial [Solirubrobacterales bacterium]|nr:hypothetical protein [Solirubrobacterales bacterium]
ERLENAFAERAGTLLDEAERDGIDVLRFNLRELWGDAHHYRCDGVWDRKTLCRLFRNRPGDRRFDPRRLHRFWMPLELVADLGRVGRHCDLDIYHLRMIEARDRERRAARYRDLDPDALYQSLGYEYLLDETGLELRRIPEERGFFPAPPPMARRSAARPLSHFSS